jgi:hypothetical protein
MNEWELSELETIRQEVLTQLKEKHGADRVQQVDDLGEATTLRMMNGELVAGVELWMYEVVEDFRSMLMTHPRLAFPELN